MRAIDDEVPEFEDSGLVIFGKFPGTNIHTARLRKSWRKRANAHREEEQMVQLPNIGGEDVQED